MPAGQPITQIQTKSIGFPVTEGHAAGHGRKRCTPRCNSRGTVGVYTATLEEIHRHIVDKIRVKTHLERVGALYQRKDVRKLETVFIREPRPRKSIGHAIYGHAGDGYARTRPIGIGSFQIPSPLESELVDLITGDRRIPTGYKKTGVNIAVSVMLNRIDKVGRSCRRRIPSIGRMPIVEIEVRTQVIRYASLVIQLCEKQILVCSTRL